MKNLKWQLPFIAISIVAILVAIGGAFLNRSALAATEPTGFKNVTLSVNPEYDDPLKLGYPTVLVMLDGQIEGATPPTTIRFLVPSDASMYSAGSGPRSNYQPPGNSLARKPSNLSGWDEVSYTLQTQYFVVEYYAPIATTPDKSFTSSFIPLYPINGLTAVVEEPRNSSNFNVTTQSQPATQQKTVGADGLNTHQYTYNTVDANQQISFSISYSSGGGSSSNTGLIVLVVVIGAALLIGLVIYGTRGRSSGSNRQSRRREAGKLQPGRSGGGRFCPKCGARLDNSTRFCPQCGTKLRQK